MLPILSTVIYATVQTVCVDGAVVFILRAILTSGVSAGDVGVSPIRHRCDGRALRHPALLLSVVAQARCAGDYKDNAMIRKLGRVGQKKKSARPRAESSAHDRWAKVDTF